MKKQEIVVCIMGQNCEKFIPMCLKSVRDADAIVYCDGGSTDGTLKYLNTYGFSSYGLKDIGKGKNRNSIWTIIQNNYDQQDKQMNGKQRNFYLDYLKENYKGWFCLCLDADEVVDTDGIKKFKEFINTLPKQNHDMLFSPKMRHLIGDLGHEDSTQPTHFVPHRLFKVRKNLKYKEAEHTVLECPNMRSQNLMLSTIWHLSYITGMFNIKKKYDNHLLKSNMHTPEFLKGWRNAHLFGVYPTTQFNPVELPDVILNNFGLDKDELYFANRGLELKHGMMVKQWNSFFHPKTVADFGCGRGAYLFFWEMNCDCEGFELSTYAANNKLCESTIYHNWDLNEKTIFNEDDNKYDFITAIDLLEHLTYKGLDNGINTLINAMHSYSIILVSIPFKGTPNCNADPTHIIKEDRAWWVEKFISKGLKEVEVPEHFLFKEQLLIFEK